MRSIGRFADELHFPTGFQLSGAFTIDECHILEAYGLTMQGLHEGSLLPTSAAEHLFLAELDGGFVVTSDFAKCWQKYSKKIARIDLRPVSSWKRKQEYLEIIDSYTDDDVLDDDVEPDN